MYLYIFIVVGLEDGFTKKPKHVASTVKKKVYFLIMLC